MRRLELLQLSGIRWRLTRIKLDAPDAGAGIGHFHQGRLFEIGCAGNGVDQVRNQVGPPLIDVLDLGPALIDALLKFDQAVIRAGHGESAHDENEKENDENTAATDGKFIHKEWIER